MDKQKRIDRILIFVASFCLGALIYSLCGCASLKRTGVVSAGAATGAAVGSLASPVGALVGAAIGGGAASAIVDSDIMQARAEKAEDRLYSAPPERRYTPPPEKAWWRQVPWWAWALAYLYLAYRNRAHLMDFLFEKGGRWDAILRALGLRTHKTSTPPTKAERAEIGRRAVGESTD